MAVCSKCGNHIKVYQMSPYCKNCGTHLLFASFEEQFEKDRRTAEMSMAYFRYNLVRFKSAYISGKAQKIKIAACLLPLISLFLPLGSLSIDTPFFSSDTTYNLFGLFVNPFVSTGLFSQLDTLAAGPLFGSVAAALKTLILFYAVTVVSAVMILLLELLCFIGNKKTGILICVFSVTGAVGSVLSKIAAVKLSGICENISFVNANDNIAFLLACILFLFAGASAVYALKNPPVRTFKEGDELRVEYRRKYKKGEIKLFDIPAPIYESEEDKKERMRLINAAYQVSDSDGEV